MNRLVGEKVFGLSVDDRILVDNAIMYTGLPAQLLEQSKTCVNWAGTHAGGIENPLSGLLPVSLLPPSVRPTQPSPMVPEPQSAAVGPNGSSSRRQLASKDVKFWYLNQSINTNSRAEHAKMLT